MEVKEGSEISGRYKCSALLGSSMMSEVWKAWDSVLSRWVALKFCDAAFSENEAMAAARLNHPNICTIHDFASFGERKVIVMEFVEGRHLLDLRPSPTVRRIATIIRDAARGVHHAHEEGVIHRDLKPENVMVTNDGRAVVTDFGLARTRRGRFTAGEVSGTPGYMSPSQMSGAAPDRRDDVFSLGVTLKAMLPANAPHELSRIAAKCSAQDPAMRHQTAGALADDLSRWLNRRRRWWLWSAAAGLLAVAGTGLAFDAKVRRVEAAERWAWNGEQLLKEENFKDAVDAYTRELSLRRTAKAYLSRSFAHAELGNLQASLDDCQRAADLEPTNQAAIRTLARAKAELAGNRGD